MKIMFCAIFLLIFSLIVNAQIYELSDGQSPNGLYKVEIEKKKEKDGNQERINYKIVNSKTQDTLLLIPSSYQPNEDEKPNGALDTAQGASLYWSKDSSRVVIDEPSFRYKGTVFVVMIVAPNKAVLVRLPNDEITKQTGFKWERYRIRVVRSGWNENNELKLACAGNILTDKKGTYRNATCYPVILVSNDLQISIKSIDKEGSIETRIRK